MGKPADKKRDSSCMRKTYLTKTDHKDIGLVTVYQGIGTRSMPYNDIVLYRYEHNMTSEQIVITPDDKADGKKDEEGLIYIKSRYRYKAMKEALRTADRHYAYRNMPYVIQCHDMGAALSVWAAASKEAKGKIIFTVHTDYKNRDRKYKYKCILAILLSHKAVVMPGRITNDLIRKIKGKNLSYITNAVNVERINAIKKEKIDRVKNRIIYIARFVDIKRHSFLVEVLSGVKKEIRDFEVVFVGDGPLMASIKELIVKYELNENIKFTGVLSREMVYRWILSSSISVSVSKYEGMPVGVLECLAGDTYGIISDISSHREIYANILDIELLPPDKNKWINSIKNALANYDITQKKAVQIGEQTRQIYSLKTMNDKYNELYYETAIGL